MISNGMEPEQKSNGALVGSIIIVIILVIGGIYLWTKSKEAKPTPANDSGAAQSSNNDDTIKMEADVNSVDLDSLDSGI